MNNQTKQIIPDSQAVIQCFDKDTLETLDSHSTFTINELLERIKRSHFGSLSVYDVDEFFRKIRSVSNYGPPDFFKEFNSIFDRKLNRKKIADILVDGTEVVLLQLDGKGWQKGTLKICFEFIPEEI
jgi:hypothetical protein